MPTFIDESGDAGPGERCSPHFRLAAVWFEADADVSAYLAAAAALRAALGVGPGFEFHFTSIGHEFRLAFLRAVAPLRFRYTVASFDKAGRDRRALTKHGIRAAVVGTVVGRLAEWYALAEGCKPDGVGLNERVVYDEGSDPDFERTLKESFRSLPSGRGPGAKLIRSVRPGRSRSDDRLQLADVVCGAVAKALDGDEVYRRLIRGNEIAVDVLRAGDP